VDHKWQRRDKPLRVPHAGTSTAPTSLHAVHLPAVSSDRKINTRYCTDDLRPDYAHVGLFDVADRRIWIARKKWGISPVRVSHARLLEGGTNTTSVADKDRFLCYWYHTPGTGEGYVQGYPIEWDEGHLLVRLDPNWNYITQEFIPNALTAKLERNVDQQFQWGESIFRAYLAKKPKFPLSWHMIGPRPTDSVFYIERSEAIGK
jgi:hypothetical protein